MARTKGPATPVHNVTAERAARLYQLVSLLAHGPQTRFALTRALRLNVRGFYRDLEVLRIAGIDVRLVKRQYVLGGNIASATARLPFPDPGLTLGEARQIARGRSRAHQKLRAQLADIEKR